MATTPASTLFLRTNEPASTSAVGFSSKFAFNELHRTDYARHEHLDRRLESQAFAPIVDNARFARRIHDMLRFVVRNAGYGVASKKRKNVVPRDCKFRFGNIHGYRTYDFAGLSDAYLSSHPFTTPHEYHGRHDLRPKRATS